MPKLTEIRAKYPQYNDMSDQQFADSFHDKFYSDMPKGEFYLSLGYSPSAGVKSSAPLSGPPKRNVEHPRAPLTMQRAKKDAVARQNSPGFLNSVGTGASYGFLNTIDANQARAQTMVENLARDVVGKPHRYSSDEAYKATKATDDQVDRKYAQERPVSNFVGNVGGGFLAPGIAKGAGWAGQGQGLLSRTARSAALGAASGAAYGAGGSEDGSRLQGAGVGALTGAAVGAVLQPVAEGVGQLVVAPAARAANKAVNAMTEGKVNLLSPAREATKALAAALKRDGATPQQAQQITNEWLRTGASSPTLLDMASRLPSGGQTTLGLVRGAALGAGPARGQAVQYAEQVASDLQPNAIRAARGLTPETRTVPQMTDDITATRRANANQNYAPLYETPVPITDDVMSAVADAPGRQTVQNAVYAATANRNYNVADELTQLLSNPEAGTQRSLSAGALEEVRRAMRDVGQSMSSSPTAPGFNRSAGLGLQDRASSLNGVLDQVPQIQPARADYGNLSAQLEALEQGAGVADNNIDPAQFAALVEQLVGKGRQVNAVGANAEIPLQAAQADILNAARVGGARQLETTFGAPTEGAMGALNRVATGTNVGQNLDTLYGTQAAADFRAALNNERTRAQNAAFINPNTGSQTAGRASDALDSNLGDAAVSIATGNFGSGIAKLFKGRLDLTDQERAEILRLALGRANLPVPPQSAAPVLSPYVTGETVQSQNRQ